MWPRMHACSLQISRMASGDEPRLNTFGCPGMATGSTHSSDGPRACSTRRRCAGARRGARSWHTNSSARFVTLPSANNIRAHLGYSPIRTVN